MWFLEWAGRLVGVAQSTNRLFKTLSYTFLENLPCIHVGILLETLYKYSAPLIGWSEAALNANDFQGHATYYGQRVDILSNM